MPMQQRSPLYAATACLGFGLVVSVALAWALSLWPTRDIGNTFQSSVNSRPDGVPSYHSVYSWSNSKSLGFRHIAIWANPGHEPINRHAARRMHDEIHAGQAGLRPDQVAVRPYVPPAWPAWLPTLPEDGAQYTEWGARAAGWPWPCLASRSATSTAGVRETRWALRIWPAPVFVGTAPRDPDQGTVPMRPLAFGLAANTLLFAAPLFLVLVVPAWIRRARRGRRGCCRWCGYDRRGLEPAQPCPECGGVQGQPASKAVR